jgi:penicillin-binding protein 2
MEPRPLFDWHRWHARRRDDAGWVDSRRRMRLGLAVFVGLLAIVLLRVVQLEITCGDEFRQAAAKPIIRQRAVPGVRGRILAHDGTVLAVDRQVPSVALHYRYLEQPVDSVWLTRQARRRLSPSQRKQEDRLEAAKADVLAERRLLAERLAALCGLGDAQWTARVGAIQRRVERIAQSVNRRRQENWARQRDRTTEPKSTPNTVIAWLADWLADRTAGRAPLNPPQPITVAEELDYHVIAEGISLEVVAEIERSPERYPGVKIVQTRRRHYPHGRLAAHLLGHLGPVPAEKVEETNADEADYRPDDRVGLTGLEAQYERLLRGADGLAADLHDRAGDRLSSYRQREPGVGRDLVLTIDSRVQRAAESLLDDALARREIEQRFTEPAGGAALIMNVRTGALLAAASSPRFDLNRFESGDPAVLDPLFADPARPLFDRASRMAIPPASVFKTVTALALLQSGRFDPHATFFCQGYLENPDRMRCAVYVRRGVGHGEITLREAMAQSCNVFFFHHAAALGPKPLIAWAAQLGFGSPAGVDLPDEAAGWLPSPEKRAAQRRPWRTADTQMLAIGQGELTATPLQIARLMAAVAVGRLVRPHLAYAVGLPQGSDDPAIAASENRPPIELPDARPQPIDGLDEDNLATLRQSLEAVVADPQGTAHDAVRLEEVSIAGKTGTAQTGAGREDHAWFAGYFPAERPQYVVVVALEHAGDGAEAAGPVARRIVLQMLRLGLVRPVATDR